MFFVHSYVFWVLFIRWFYLDLAILLMSLNISQNLLFYWLWGFLKKKHILSSLENSKILTLSKKMNIWPFVCSLCATVLLDSVSTCLGLQHQYLHQWFICFQPFRCLLVSLFSRKSFVKVSFFDYVTSWAWLISMLQLKGEY